MRAIISNVMCVVAVIASVVFVLISAIDSTARVVSISSSDPTRADMAMVGLFVASVFCWWSYLISKEDD